MAVIPFTQLKVTSPPRTFIHPQTHTHTHIPPLFLPSSHPPSPASTYFSCLIALSSSVPNTKPPAPLPHRLSLFRSQTDLQSVLTVSLLLCFNVFLSSPALFFTQVWIQLVSGRRGRLLVRAAPGGSETTG